MDANVSIDVGKNIAELLEKLAHQIGTTADKVFPWYVKQQVIDGYVFIAFTILALAVSIMGLKVCWKKSDFEDGNLAAVLTVAFFVLLVGAGLATFFGIPGAISQILNPEYHALHSITQDMAKLIGK